jgi:shikimate 5-dehydrogenase
VPILAKAAVPTVVVGLGETGVMLSVLGQKLGAPWAYGALERGAESFPGQATARELVETYHLPSIGPATRLVGVTGFDEGNRATLGALNAAFASESLAIRCLPLGIGRMDNFGKIIAALKLLAVAVDYDHRRSIVSLAGELDAAAVSSSSADLILRRTGTWRAIDTYVRTALNALEAAARTRWPVDEPLRGRPSVVIGANETALTMAQELKARGADIMVAWHDAAAGRRIAQQAEARFIDFEDVSTIQHGVLVVCEHAPERPATQATLRASTLSTDTAVLDLTAAVRVNPFVREATTRGCAVVVPEELWLDHVSAQVKALIGKEVPRPVLKRVTAWLQG